MLDAGQEGRRELKEFHPHDGETRLVRFDDGASNLKAFDRSDVNLLMVACKLGLDAWPGEAHQGGVLRVGGQDFGPRMVLALAIVQKFPPGGHH